jgi:hypothetical protein
LHRKGLIHTPEQEGLYQEKKLINIISIGGVTSYVDLYQDHPSMIFCFFLTAGHLPHSTLVADRNFLTAEAKNVYNYSRNFSVRGMPHRRNSYVFFFFSWPERERDRRSQVSLSFVSLSFTLYFTLVGGAIRPTVGRPHGSTIVVFFSVQLELV